MSKQSVYRYGGIATFVSIALIIVDTVVTGVASPANIPLSSRLLNSASVIALIPMFYALYAIFRDDMPAFSRVSWLEYVGAAILYVISMLILHLRPLALYNFAFFAVNMVPALLFGIVIVQQPQSGMPRALGILGIVSGILGAVRYLVLTLGGGDWTNLNNPALQPVIFMSYMAWVVLGVIWMIWVGILLLRHRA